MEGKRFGDGLAGASGTVGHNRLLPRATYSVKFLIPAVCRWILGRLEMERQVTATSPENSPDQRSAATSLTVCLPYMSRQPTATRS